MRTSSPTTCSVARNAQEADGEAVEENGNLPWVRVLLPSDPGGDPLLGGTEAVGGDGTGQPPDRRPVLEVPVTASTLLLPVNQAAPGVTLLLPLATSAPTGPFLRATGKLPETKDLEVTVEYDVDAALLLSPPAP